ncbi:MAG: VanW family protein [Solirubrobacteraceae bacterium]|nr:VanW family protein [Solirubrobacteraceae bacterium]
MSADRPRDHSTRPSAGARPSSRGQRDDTEHTRAFGAPGDEDFDHTREFDFGPGGRPGDRPRRGDGRGRDVGGRGRGGRHGSPPPTTGRGPRPNRPHRERRPAWQRVAFAVAAVVVVLGLSIVAVRAAYSGKALPGTEVAGEDVGGKTEAEVRAIVRILADPARRITLVAPGKTLRASAGGAGLQANESQTVKRAMDARRGSLFGPLITFVAPSNVDLVAVVERDALRGSVARVAGTIDRKPYAGALTIDPDTLAITTKASAPGREVDRSELTDRLERAVLDPQETRVEVPVETTDAVSDERVEEVAADAEQYLRAPLVLSGAGKPYTVTPAALSKILALEPLDGGREARLGVNTEEASALAQRVAAARDRAAKSATISAPSRGPIVDGKAEVSWQPKKADVSVTADGRTGLAVKVRDLTTRIRGAVRQNSHRATVPTSTTKPPVSKAAAEKIDRVIGTFTTYYIAGQPRVTNIKRIARSADRTVIPPGGQFSLNGISGERTLAKGYVEAPFIAGNKIEPSVGGGVSQFSTTMYNAAYFAGLRLDAYRAHSLFIDRYPAGRESTLNFPDIDMKWTNDTGAPILVRAYTDDAGVTVTLYGNNGGRKVVAKPGSREPNPGGDFQITVTREITYRDGRVVTQPLTTKYANEVTEEAPTEPAPTDAAPTPTQ